MHLIVDGYSQNQGLLQDEGSLRDWLERFPSRIDMNRISSPYVVRYVGSKPHDWGISGFVFIAESHISIHTFVEHGYVNIDVFSCKDFDTDKAVDELRGHFQLSKLRTSLIDREWSAEPPAGTDPAGPAYHGKRR